jgi:F0F1-type ATP synthase membrane subunit b/b'
MTLSRYRPFLAVLLFACLLGLAGAAAAEGPPENGPGVETAPEGGHEADHAALYKWINFILLAGGLGYVLRKPASEYFLQRSASIRKSLDEGRKALEDSQAQLREVEEKLQHIEEAMAEFRSAALKEMEEEHARIRQTAAEQAEKMIVQRLDEAGQKRLVHEFAARLEAKPNLN